MKVLAVRMFSVEIEDSGYRSEVFEQGDKRLKCQSHECKSRNHFKCEHVRFVQAQDIVIPGLPPLSAEDMADLIDE
jgi:hypothetical protein